MKRKIVVRNEVLVENVDFLWNENDIDNKTTFMR